MKSASLGARCRSGRRRRMASCRSRNSLVEHVVAVGGAVHHDGDEGLRLELEVQGALALEQARARRHEDVEEGLVELEEWRTSWPGGSTCGTKAAARLTLRATRGNAGEPTETEAASRNRRPRRRCASAARTGPRRRRAWPLASLSGAATVLTKPWAEPDMSMVRDLVGEVLERRQALHLHDGIGRRVLAPRAAVHGRGVVGGRRRRAV